MWGETASLYRPSGLIPKRMSMNLRIPRHVAKIGRPASSRILYHSNLNPKPALNRYGGGAACLSSQLFAWEQQALKPHACWLLARKLVQRDNRFQVECGTACLSSLLFDWHTRCVCVCVNKGGWAAFAEEQCFNFARMVELRGEIQLPEDRARQP